MEEIPEIGAFYRKPLVSIHGDVKFSSQNVGVNKLEQYTKLMFDAAGIDTTNRKITNHSMKATLCSTMWKAGFDDQAIKSRSGHRSKEVEAYKRIDKSFQNRISRVLQPPRGSSTTQFDKNLTPKKAHLNPHLIKGMRLQALPPLKTSIHYSKSPRKDNLYSLKSTKHFLNDIVVMFTLTFLRYQDLTYCALMTNYDEH